MTDQDTFPQQDQPGPLEEPRINLAADEITYDEDQAVVTASGSVEVIYGDRQLFADQISYSQNDDVVTANGSVVVIEPSGERLFADRMELSGDLRDAVAENIGLLLSDDARIAGAGARLVAGNTTTFTKAVYSPCRLCPENPERAPLWQVKAVNVSHDKKAQLIEYEDAWLEVMGIPVVYTPYFNHPDPTVQRESGFLPPSIGTSSDLGIATKLPYYYVINDQADITIAPTYFAQEGLLGEFEYRHRFKTGELISSGSFINTDEDENRGHIFAEGTFDLNKTWRAGFDVNRATDDTFLRRYGFESPQVLESKVFVEGFRGRNYLSATGFSFQDLRPIADPLGSPNVLPLIEFSHVGLRDKFGGSLGLEANLMSLTRRADDGHDTRRLSLRPTYTRRFSDTVGNLYELKAGVFADFYNVSDFEFREGDTFNGSEYRLVPYASAEWRLPLVSSTSRHFTQTITPIVNVVTAPNGGNPEKIPNEDSQELEFDTTNLFGVNRFGGIDRVEEGHRINYGVQYGIFGENNRSATFLVGQTYRFATDDTFSDASGLSDRLSDVVAAAEVKPVDYLTLRYRTQIDIDEIEFRRNELELSGGVPLFRPSVRYFFFGQQAGSEFESREEINLSLSSQLSERWSARFAALRDLQDDQMRRFDLDLTYEDECLLISGRFVRTFFEDRDLTPSDSFTINFLFKTLGGASQTRQLGGEN